MTRTVMDVDEQTLLEQYKKIVVVPVIPDRDKVDPALFRRPSLYGEPQKVITRPYVGV